MWTSKIAVFYYSFDSRVLINLWIERKKHKHRRCWDCLNFSFSAVFSATFSISHGKNRFIAFKFLSLHFHSSVIRMSSCVLLKEFSMISARLFFSVSNVNSSHNRYEKLYEFIDLLQWHWIHVWFRCVTHPNTDNSIYRYCTWFSSCHTRLHATHFKWNLIGTSNCNSWNVPRFIQVQIEWPLRRSKLAACKMIRHVT